MEKEKALKRYIAPGIGLQIVTFFLLAAFVASCCLIVIDSLRKPAAVQAQFDSTDSETHTMAYLDVVGVSNWLYRSNEDYCYYSAIDAEENLYTVYLSDEIYDQMTAQQEFWLDLSAPMEVFRLEAYVQNLPGGARDELADCWDITPDEYTQFFGNKYLDTSSTLKGERTALWVLIALFSGLFLIAPLIEWLKATKAYRVCWRNLEERGLLERAAQQFAERDRAMVVGKKQAILTEDFIFSDSTGIALPYSDILWAYAECLSMSYFMQLTNITVATAALKPCQIATLWRKGLDTAGDVLDTIREKNPRALIGVENKAEYKSAYKNR